MIEILDLLAEREFLVVPQVCLYIRAKEVAIL